MQGGGHDVVFLTVDDVRKSLKEMREKRQVELNSYEQEYSKIEELTHNHDYAVCDFASARKADNRVKNRYTNVLPVESTRVKISEYDDNDYINANYINGEIEGSQKSYIAAQGPLEDTCGDFWKMIWLENTNIIVMLTRLVENDRCKCHKYWPNKETLQWSFLKITHILPVVKFTSEIKIRKFLIENTETRESREVTQFQFREWPDHGLPENTVHFRQLLKIVNKENKKNGPIVVDCSAGIGRTGTFCAVDSTLKKIYQQQEKNQRLRFNMFNTVLRLRKERPGMVQTKEQYIFCYLAVFEELEDALSKAHADSHKGNEVQRLSGGHNGAV